MGTYLFKWEYPASQVLVTGSFDNWSRSIQLKRENGVFQKQVDFPSAKEKILYKFVVDGDWKLHPGDDLEVDGQGNKNNVLHPEKMREITSRAPVGTAVPQVVASKEVLKQSVSDVFKDDPVRAFNAKEHFPVDLDPRKVADAFKNDAIDPTGNPFFDDPVSAPGSRGFVEVERDPRTVASAFRDDPIDTTRVIRSGGPWGDGPEPQIKRVASGGPYGKDGPSSSSQWDNAGGAAAGGAAIATVGAGATTAALAGDVPKEPRGVPEVVKDSKAGGDHGAYSADAVEKKAEMEKELGQKVPEKGAGSDPGPGVGAAVAAGGAAVVGAGAVAYGASKLNGDSTSKTEGARSTPVVNSIHGQIRSGPDTAAAGTAAGGAIVAGGVGYIAATGSSDGAVTPGGPPIADADTLPAIIAANRDTYLSDPFAEDPVSADPTFGGGATQADLDVARDPRTVAKEFANDPISAASDSIHANPVSAPSAPAPASEKINDVNANSNPVTSTSVVSNEVPNSTSSQDYGDDSYDNKPFANRKAAPSPGIGGSSVDGESTKKKKSFRKRFSNLFVPEVMREQD